MNWRWTKKLVSVAGFAAALAALADPAAAAEAKKANRPANCGKVTVTDAAGRTHTRLKLSCTTPADRKAAAKRLRLQRAAAAAKTGGQQ